VCDREYPGDAKKSQKKLELLSPLVFFGIFFSKNTFFRIFRCATEFGIVVTKKIGNPPNIEKVFVAKTA
jgi:hypothetical protein